LLGGSSHIGLILASLGDGQGRASKGPARGFPAV